MNTLEYQVRLEDVTRVQSDLLLLKHAQAFYGADKAVASSLISLGLCQREDIQPEPGNYAIVETKGLIAPARIMFLGTPCLAEFSYEEMRIFARRAIEVIATLTTPPKVITTTVHGSANGMDGGESLQRLIRGFQEGLAETQSSSIEKIAFITLVKDEEQKLNSVLSCIGFPATLPTNPPPIMRSPQTPHTDSKQLDFAPERHHGQSTEETKLVGDIPMINHIHVAIPTSDEFENVYEYGILPAVSACGFVCSRIRQPRYLMDIGKCFDTPIDSSSILIVDLSPGGSNFHLEMGYALGRGARVILIVRKSDELPLTVDARQCIHYGKFAQLAKDLAGAIKGPETRCSAPREDGFTKSLI